jgi:hypothetical protein
MKAHQLNEGQVIFGDIFPPDAKGAEVVVPAAGTFDVWLDAAGPDRALRRERGLPLRDLPDFPRRLA